MKKIIISGFLILTLALIGPVASALAQELNSLYITPKILYTKQKGDMTGGNWVQNGWNKGVLSGEDDDTNFGFGVALGNDFSYSSSLPIRGEVEYVYHGDAGFKKGPSVVFGTPGGGDARVASHEFDVKAHSLMANAFYDFNIDSIITPYVGGGIGVSYMKTNYKAHINGTGPATSVSVSNNNWDFAWNIGGGAVYQFNDTMALDVGYRYFDLGTAEPGKVNTADYKGSPKVDYTAHELSVGVRFTGF